MRNIMLSVLVVWCQITFISAQIQVGLQTDSPETLFHVDAKKNNATAPSATKYDDDIAVDALGNMGIGTKNPQTKIHIKNTQSASLSDLRIEDGTAGVTAGLFLTSDANGVGTWKRQTSSTIFTWQIKNSSFNNITTNQQVTGTVTTLGSMPGVVTNNTDYSLTVPKGDYMFMLYGDNSFGIEYALMTLMATYTGGGTAQLMSFRYENNLYCSAAYIRLTDTAKIKLYYQGLNGAIATWFGTSGDCVPDGRTSNIWYELAMLKLK